MQPISIFNIQQEIENIKTDKDLKNLVANYPTRVHVTLHFQVDGEKYIPSGDYYIDNYGDFVIEKAV